MGKDLLFFLQITSPPSLDALKFYGNRLLEAIMSEGNCAPPYGMLWLGATEQ